jgi:hypothetical protein
MADPNQTTPEQIIEAAIRKGIGWDGLTIGSRDMTKQVIGDLYAAGYQIIEAEVVDQHGP